MGIFKSISASAASAVSLALLLLLASTAAVIATDPLLLSVLPSQSSDGIVKFVASARLGNAASTTVNLTIDTAVSSVSVPSKEVRCKSGQINFTFSSVIQNDFFPGGDVEVAGIKVLCTSDGSINTLGLGSGTSGLPSQLWSTQRLRKTFAYCLSPSQTGQLSFGRTFYRVFRNTDVLQGRTATLVRIPLSASYQVELTGVGIGSTTKQLPSTKVFVASTPRYTSLPSEAYSLLRSGVEAAAASRKISRASNSTFGPLDLCYKMSTSQLRSFPNVTMVFSNKVSWTVSPPNYLVSKPGTSIACFAITSTSRSAPAIGSFQQEDNWVEYDLGNRTLGVSGSLPAQFSLGCGNTYGS